MPNTPSHTAAQAAFQSLSDQGLTLSPEQQARIEQCLSDCISGTKDSNVVESDITIGVRDWQLAKENPPTHELSVRAGNQTHVRLADDAHELALIIEINEGVPAVHVYVDDEDAALHLHQDDNGEIVVTPGSNLYLAVEPPGPLTYQKPGSFRLT